MKATGLLHGKIALVTGGSRGIGAALFLVADGCCLMEGCCYEF